MSDKIAFYSKDVSDNLEIAASTLRKWSAMLEDAGYPFKKNDKGQRLYYEKDIVALRHLKRLTQDEGMALENAVKEVVKRVKETEAIARELDVPSDTSRYDDKFDQLFERIERLEMVNCQLIEKLNEQQRYINEQLEKRDRQLVKEIRESLEVRRQLAASQEETKKQKRGLIARLFGK
jgi:DNA-binding transcriptional MerR regulator